MSVWLQLQGKGRCPWKKGKSREKDVTVMDVARHSWVQVHHPHTMLKLRDYINTHTPSVSAEPSFLATCSVQNPTSTAQARRWWWWQTPNMAWHVGDVWPLCFFGFHVDNLRSRFLKSPFQLFAFPTFFFSLARKNWGIKTVLAILISYIDHWKSKGDFHIIIMRINSCSFGLL